MSDPAAPASTRRRLGIFLPLILFSALALLFLYRLFTGDPQRLPSALIGKPAPATVLPAMPGLGAAGVAVPGIDAAAKPGIVTVLNIFASWCIPCREEHPVLIDLARTAKAANIRLIGLNYKDQPAAGLKFLNDFGNPYQEVGVDATGRAGIEWGVYGVPETFVVSPGGLITYKHIGPLSPEKLKTLLLPEIEKARSR